MRHPAPAPALLLALTSQGRALAREAVEVPGMQATLCTGDGAVTVTLDARGNPVAPARHCPACVLALSLPPGVPVAGLPLRLARFVPVAPLQRLAKPGAAHPTPPARASPLPA